MASMLAVLPRRQALIETRIRQRLATIMVADAVAYSRLIDDLVVVQQGELLTRLGPADEGIE
jgi:hypothetical protein